MQGAKIFRILRMFVIGALVFPGSAFLAMAQNPNEVVVPAKNSIDDFRSLFGVDRTDPNAAQVVQAHLAKLIHDTYGWVEISQTTLVNANFLDLRDKDVSLLRREVAIARANDLKDLSGQISAATDFLEKYDKAKLNPGTGVFHKEPGPN